MVTDGQWRAFEVTGGGASPVVLACEHASRAIPADLAALGLDRVARRSHAAWDIGALAVARRLSDRLGAPLVAGALSRLVYDCNRPPDAPDAIAERSEVFDVPGNRRLDDAARRERFERVHVPFHAALAETCAAQTESCGRAIALVTLHSFTPVYLGRRRRVAIGFLHASDPALAEAALAAETARGVWFAALNEPYSTSDGVTHTLALHGEAAGRRALMIELRNDLIATEADADYMGDHLAVTLARALPDIAFAQDERAAAAR